MFSMPVKWGSKLKSTKEQQRSVKIYNRNQVFRFKRKYKTSNIGVLNYRFISLPKSTS